MNLPQPAHEGPQAASPADEVTFFGHPIALFVLFFTELWERFSFYGMRALLVLFMVSEFGFSDAKAYGIYAAYGSLVYATPILGGMFADRFLGFRNAIVLGGLVMTLGHLTLGFEPFLGGGEGSHTIFYAALAMLIIGNGFFKPNISNLVGGLYADGDPRRDGAFTIFYMGINAGAFMAPLACGTIGEVWGWHYGFGLAGIGMAVGLVIFLLAQKYLGDLGHPPHRQANPAAPAWNTSMFATWGGAFAAIPVFMFLVQQNEYLTTGIPMLGFGVLAALLYIAFSSTKAQREQMFVIITLIFFSMIFWAFFEQAGSSINLFTERNVDKNILGWEFPTTWGQALNPGFIILMAPVFSWLWLQLGKADRDPTPGYKFALSLMQLGLGFVVLWASQFFADGAGQVPLVFLLAGYFLHTTGELCMSPVGLSMVTKLSPAKSAGFVMGAWFLSSAFAHFIAGGIAKLTGGGGHGAEAVVHGGTETLATYTSVFGGIGAVAIGSGVVCLALSPVLKKWMHGVR